MTRKGWFKVRGQDGDRTPEEQMLGLERALAEAKGKTVLDLGCAEGAIAREFALAGATVLGVELLQDHINVGRKVCRGLAVKFVCASLEPYIDANPEHERFDIVLALSIAHKLKEPGKLLAFAARCANDLVVFRGPGKKDMFWDGWLKAKFGEGQCHVPTLMAEHGFVDEGIVDSARGERVQYWRRKAF